MNYEVRSHFVTDILLDFIETILIFVKIEKYPKLKYEPSVVK